MRLAWPHNCWHRGQDTAQPAAIDSPFFVPASIDFALLLASSSAGYLTRLQPPGSALFSLARGPAVFTPTLMADSENLMMNRVSRSISRIHPVWLTVS
jgi:hypothetical protein